MPSFDVVSQVELQEIDNAVNQTLKEISQRYDFKNSKTTIEWRTKEKEIVIVADDDYKLSAATDIMQSKMVKRQIPLKNMKYGTIEQATGDGPRQRSCEANHRTDQAVKTQGASPDYGRSSARNFQEHR